MRQKNSKGEKQFAIALMSKSHLFRKKVVFYGFFEFWNQKDGYFLGGSTQEAGFNAFYMGLSIGTAAFDYDDIDDGDAFVLYAGVRSRGERLGYEFSYINTGDAEVRGLDDIELRVEALVFSLTYNSSKNAQLRWNAYGSAGIYLAGATLSEK